MVLGEKHGTNYLPYTSKSGKENYEVFITSAVCSALAEHTHMEMQIGGTYARGSNAENNRSCN